MPKLDELLLNMDATGASDLHMAVGQKPKYRIDGDVVIQEDYPVMGKDMVEEYLSAMP